MLLQNKTVEFTSDTCEQYRDYMFNIASKITRNKEYAEDVVQETMYKLIKISQNLSGKPEEEIQKYIRKSVTNNAFTYMKNARREVPTENLPEDTGFDSVLESVLATDDKMQMRKALKLLTNRQRIVLALMFYQNWTTEQIARELGITTVSVRSLKKRGLEKLREILSQEDDYK